MTDASKPSHVALRVGIRELRANLTHYVREVGEGKVVLVTSRNSVVAELRPSANGSSLPRQLGLLRGKIQIADDFDTWPEDVLDAMER